MNLLVGSGWIREQQERSVTIVSICVRVKARVQAGISWRRARGSMFCGWRGRSWWPGDRTQSKCAGMSQSHPPVTNVSHCVTLSRHVTHKWSISSQSVRASQIIIRQLNCDGKVFCDFTACCICIMIIILTCVTGSVSRRSRVTRGPCEGERRHCARTIVSDIIHHDDKYWPWNEWT